MKYNRCRKIEVVYFALKILRTVMDKTKKIILSKDFNYFTLFLPYLNPFLYASKLINHIDAMTERIMDQIEKGPRIHDVHFSDLDVRLNQPYWLLHQGSCEHYLVIEQIRWGWSSFITIPSLNTRILQLVKPHRPNGRLSYHYSHKPSHYWLMPSMRSCSGYCFYRWRHKARTKPM